MHFSLQRVHSEHPMLAAPGLYQVAWQVLFPDFLPAQPLSLLSPDSSASFPHVLQLQLVYAACHQAPVHPHQGSQSLLEDDW